MPRWEVRWRDEEGRHLREQFDWEQRRDEARRVWDEDERTTRARRLLRGELLAMEESPSWSLGDLDLPFALSCRVLVPDPPGVPAA